MKETKTKIWPWVNQKKMREREKMIMQTIEMVLESENLSSNVTSELWNIRLINRDLSSIIDNNDKLEFNVSTLLHQLNSSIFRWKSSLEIPYFLICETLYNIVHDDFPLFHMLRARLLSTSVPISHILTCASSY